MSSLDVITVVTLPSAGPSSRCLSLSLVSPSHLSLMLLCVISAEGTGKRKESDCYQKISMVFEREFN